MTEHTDFKKEWERTKKQLKAFGQEAIKLAHQGEKEILKLSQQSKWHLDSTAIVLKKDRLYFLIGKEFAKLKNPPAPTKELEKLFKELKDLASEERTLKRKIKKTV